MKTEEVVSLQQKMVFIRRIEMEMEIEMEIEIQTEIDVACFLICRH